MTLIQTLFGLKGRLRRRDWWGCTLLLLIGERLAGVLLHLLLVGPLPIEGGARLFSAIGGAAEALPPIPEALLALVFLWSHTAIGVKRLHDGGTPSWPVWLYSGLSLAGILLLVFEGSLEGALGGFERLMEGAAPWPVMAMSGFVGVVFLCFSFWLFFRLAIRDGLTGETIHGPDPKAASPAV